MGIIEGAVLIVAAALIGVFWRVMSRAEYRDSLEGRAVVGVTVSAVHDGSTVSVIVTNTTRKAGTFGVFAIVLTQDGWFESTRMNNPLHERLNPGQEHRSVWEFPDVGDHPIEQIDILVCAPYEPYRIALRALTPESTRETALT